MRKYLRAIARHRMDLCGYEHINKKRHDEKGKPVPSIFAQTWRKILTPGTPHYDQYRKVSWRRGVR